MTDKKSVSEAMPLRLSEEQKATLLLDVAPVAAFLVAADGVLLACNAAFRGLVSDDEAALCGQPLRVVLGGMQWPLHADALWRCAHLGKPVRYELVRDENWLVCSLYPVASAENTAGYIAGYMVEFSSVVSGNTERWVPQDTARQEADAHGAQAISVPAKERAHAPMAYISSTGHILEAGVALCRLLGKQQDELRGCGFATLFHPGEQASVGKYLHEGLHAGVEGLFFEARLDVEDPVARWCRVHVSGLRTGDSRPLCGVVLVEDVSGEKSLHVDSMRAGQLASLGELAAGVAHEVNNPVNGIINYAQLLLEAAQERKAAFEANIARNLIKEGTRIARTVHNLLFFARDRRQDRTPLRAEAILQEALDLMQALLQREGILLDINVSQDLPMVYGNRRELQQVYLSIISNARQALNRRYAAPCPEKRLVIKLYARHEPIHEVVTEFVDQGGGISQHTRELIEADCVSPESIDTAGELPGLWLSISRSIVKEHQGALELESDSRTYTRVLVSLPVLKGAE